ncbi:flagellar protein FlbT [Paracoccus aminovorans]|uniref:Flagellar protein FlbT n=1 Tax=Paracoccus aminovorans TaxID=34004 RepID=A0A1I3C5Y4_9RHOB|nr:flagellar biosynthesis repressor FlbT [Paracoccus aminovorans]CQR84499.1 flagellar biosynthesis repressor FlbT [Paracoccus aminovorans]SFH69736.1 flagellar protein FlbT [Paracoccus aminovorans]
MTGLILKLAPNERVLINGAVIENSDRRAKISIRNPNARILRLKDAIHPDEANSPVSRLCYVCQLILTGDADREEGHRQLILGIEQLSQVFADTDSRFVLSSATQAALGGDYYRAMKKIKLLRSREARLLAVHGT